MINERLPDILGESFQLVLMQEKSSIWQLSLPIKTLDNDNFEIYLRKTGKNYHLFDDGNTLWTATGLGAKSKLFKEKLALVAHINELNLDKFGELNTTCTEDNLIETVGRFIKALTQIDLFLATDPELFQVKENLYEIAKNMLSELTAGLVCKPKISFTGYSTNKYSFDFKINDLLVDALPPSGNSINSCIAKVVDIRAALSDEREQNFYPTALIDDRFVDKKDKHINGFLKKLTTIMSAYTFSQAPRLVERSSFL